MISFSPLDIFIILFFFALLLLIGFISSKKTKSTSEDYLLSGRKVGLFLFVLISVSTWYGGIIGVGEFTYRYGLVSWFTQGFPYYFFAFLFAIFFAKKIRAASLFTIPEKLTEVYGKKVSWVLTAERNDPYMRQNPQAGDVVVDKGPRRGQYLTPDLYGQPKEKAIGFYEPRKLEASEMVETTAPILEKKNKEKIEFKAEEYPKRITKKGEEKENALSQDEAQPSVNSLKKD